MHISKTDWITNCKFFLSYLENYCNINITPAQVYYFPATCPLTTLALRHKCNQQIDDWKIKIAFKAILLCCVREKRKEMQECQSMRRIVEENGKNLISNQSGKKEKTQKISWLKDCANKKKNKEEEVEVIEKW